MEGRRIDYQSRPAAAAGLRAMTALEQAVRQSGLEPRLLELVRLRASQLNGCAFCIDMHTKDARAEGETEQRLYLVQAWGETSFFTPRERAALAWTEAVTRISPEAVDDALFGSLREHFSEDEVVALTFAVIAINGWNRLAISFRTPAGSYQRQPR